VKTFLSYGLAIVGLVMMAIAFARVLAVSLSYPAARLMMTNLLRTNPNRAEVVCRTMKGTFYEAIGAAIKTAAMVGIQDPVVLASATKPAYDAAATMIGLAWKQTLGKLKTGGMALGGAVAIALASDTMPIALVVIIALVGISAAAFVLVRRAEIGRGVMLARAEVLPEVDRAFAEGRYALPPR
jgi:hypothetical protein